MNSGWVAYDDIELRKMETYTLSYDQENRMTGMAGGSISASFVYDGWNGPIKVDTINVQSNAQTP